MKTESRHTQFEKGKPDKNGQELLSELMELLKKQLFLAKNGEIKKAVPLSNRAEELLDELSRLATPVDKNTAQCIRQLYNSLCLVFATEKKQLSERLARIKNGRISHGAYKSAMPKNTAPTEIGTVTPPRFF